MPAATGVAAASRAEARAFVPVPPADARPVPIEGGALLSVTGVGDARATAGARALIDAGAGALVSFGFAAGLRPDLAAGTLLVPRRVLGRDGAAYPVDVALGASLRACLPALRPRDEGDLVETATPLHTADEKAALHRAHGASAADMESAATRGCRSRCCVPSSIPPRATSRAARAPHSPTTAASARSPCASDCSAVRGSSARWPRSRATSRPRATRSR
jgi:adenosylhomocysteine nucleosidase